MQDQSGTNQELIEENQALKQKIKELEYSEAQYKRPLEELDIIRNRLSKAEIISRSGNWEFDMESNLVFASEGARNVYGVQNLGWTIPDIQKIPLPEYRSYLDQALHDLINGNRPYDVEFKIRRPDNGKIVDIRSVAEYDSKRNLVFGIIQDITAQKHAEEEFRKSEEKYRELVDNANSIILRMDDVGNVTFFNEFAQHFFGYSEAEILGKNVVGTIVPELESTGRNLRLMIEEIGRTPNKYTNNINENMRSNGERVWIAWTNKPVRDKSGRVTEILCVGNDITERRRAEEEVRWKTALLEAQLNTSIDGILVVDGNQKRILTNRRLIDLWDIPQHILDEEDDAALLNYVASLVKYPEEFIEKVEYLYNHPYETSRDEIEFKSGMVLDRYSGPVLGADGYHYGRIWTFHDITDRRRAEEALKQSESLYRAIFENTGAATVVLEKDKTIGLANTEYERLSGYKKEEIEGKKRWTEFVVKDDLERMLAKPGLRRIGAKSAQKQYEFRFVDRYGKIKNVALCFDRIPGTKKIIASLLDITDLKRAEETLRESQRELADIIEFFPDATMIIDKNGRITAWNQAMEVLTGIKAEAMLGKGNYEYAIPFHGRRRPILIDHVLNPDSDYEFENTYTTLQTERGILWGEGFATNLPTGDCYCSATAAALRDSRGETVAAIECIRNITEQKKIEARLHRAEKMEALGALAGGVAHDLNNVLGALVGYSELLMIKLPEDGSLKRYAQHILQSSERGAAIIQDLLTLARRGVTVSEVANINKVVADYLESPEYEKLKSYHCNVLVRTELAEDLFNIKGSPVHLGKTVMNLVSNAVEAVSDVGIVTVKTENRYVDYAISGYDDVQEGNYVVLSVSDTGGGISAKDLGKIFEPFYTKKAMGKSGTGLGLAVVWGTVKDHEGYIEVKSDEGAGSTFTLYFPVTREELMRKSEKADMASYMGRGESVLVIDDMEVQRELAINLLSKLNYKVDAVPSGEAAVAYLRDHKADLLLLDMLMTPGIDGFETFKRIREIEPNQKAIIVSGFAETERVRMAQDIGAGEYVRKPYNLEKIGLAIRRELDRT
jgi:PAS domain S-box-containing protein